MRWIALSSLNKRFERKNAPYTITHQVITLYDVLKKEYMNTSRTDTYTVRSKNNVSKRYSSSSKD